MGNAGEVSSTSMLTASRLVVVACCVVRVAALEASAQHSTTAPEAGAVRLERIERDCAELLEGVKSVAAPGVPGPLVVFGEDAFAVVAGGFGRGNTAAVVAAGRLGAGRVVAFGHTGYAGVPDAGDTSRFVRNAISWAGAGNRALPRSNSADSEKPGAVFRVAARGEWVESLRGLGFDVRALHGDDWAQQLRDVDVLCIDQQPLDDTQSAAITAHVTSGGGLLAAGLGWGWLQLNPGRRLSDHPLNRLLCEAGILWADGSLEKTADGGFAASPPTALCQASLALDAVKGHSEGVATLGRKELIQAAATLSLAARTLPRCDSLLMPRLKELRASSNAQRIPTDAAPISVDDALARLLLTLDLEAQRDAPANEVRPHPAAEVFPGPVPADAARVERAVIIDTGVPGWHSTGLYAAAGDVITVECSAAASAAGLAVRIGAHRDPLWHLDEWKRVPEITLERSIDDSTLRVASAFGGPVYIVAPPDCRAGRVALTLHGAIEMPLFVLDETEPALWRDSIRMRPAPWAELASNKLILTIPAAIARKLDDPAGVMRFWDEIMDAHATLAALPLKRERPERIVTDVQISAGYMHAGYPIMTHLDVQGAIVDVAALRRGEKLWGFVHELGHNHQEAEWTFDGTVEVTCNLFSLHAIDTICAPKPADRGHAALDQAAKTAKYLSDGAKFDAWKRDPFLALQMYMQLERAFGWATYKRVFAEYRTLPPDERSKTDAERRDQWMVRFSRAAGRNLGPFFETWGIPTSESARQSIAELPVWMPEGFPPK